MNTRKMVYTSIFIALGIILPIAFHYLGTGLGAVFLPMHIPVFIGGAFLGGGAGLIIGFVTPILSSLFTGMPPVIPMLPIMLVELSIYGFIMGFFFKRIDLNVYISLIVSMLIGRIGAGVVVWVMVHILDFKRLPSNPLIYVWGSITTGLPGIIIQIIVLPLTISYLINFRTTRDLNLKGRV